MEKNEFPAGRLQEVAYRGPIIRSYFSVVSANMGFSSQMILGAAHNAYPKILQTYKVLCNRDLSDTSQHLMLASINKLDSAPIVDSRYDFEHLGIRLAAQKSCTLISSPFPVSFLFSFCRRLLRSLASVDAVSVPYEDVILFLLKNLRRSSLSLSFSQSTRSSFLLIQFRIDTLNLARVRVCLVNGHKRALFRFDTFVELYHLVCNRRHCSMCHCVCLRKRTRVRPVRTISVCDLSTNLKESRRRGYYRRVLRRYEREARSAGETCQVYPVCSHTSRRYPHGARKYTLRACPVCTFKTNIAHFSRVVEAHLLMRRFRAGSDKHSSKEKTVAGWIPAMRNSFNLFEKAPFFIKEKNLFSISSTVKAICNVHLLLDFVCSIKASGLKILTLSLSDSQSMLRSRYSALRLIRCHAQEVISIIDGFPGTRQHSAHYGCRGGVFLSFVHETLLSAVTFDREPFGNILLGTDSERVCVTDTDRPAFYNIRDRLDAPDRFVQFFLNLFLRRIKLRPYGLLRLDTPFAVFLNDLKTAWYGCSNDDAKSQSNIISACVLLNGDRIWSMSFIDCISRALTFNSLMYRKGISLGRLRRSRCCFNTWSLTRAVLNRLIHALNGNIHDLANRTRMELFLNGVDGERFVHSIAAHQLMVAMLAYITLRRQVYLTYPSNRKRHCRRDLQMVEGYPVFSCSSDIYVPFDYNFDDCDFAASFLSGNEIFSRFFVSDRNGLKSNFGSTDRGDGDDFNTDEIVNRYLSIKPYKYGDVVINFETRSKIKCVVTAHFMALIKRASDLSVKMLSPIYIFQSGDFFKRDDLYVDKGLMFYMRSDRVGALSIAVQEVFDSSLFYDMLGALSIEQHLDLSILHVYEDEIGIYLCDPVVNMTIDGTRIEDASFGGVEMTSIQPTTIGLSSRHTSPIHTLGTSTISRVYAETTTPIIKPTTTTLTFVSTLSVDNGDKAVLTVSQDMDDPIMSKLTPIQRATTTTPLLTMITTLPDEFVTASQALPNRHITTTESPTPLQMASDAVRSFFNFKNQTHDLVFFVKPIRSPGLIENISKNNTYRSFCRSVVFEGGKALTKHMQISRRRQKRATECVSHLDEIRDNIEKASLRLMAGESLFTLVDGVVTFKIPSGLDLNGAVPVASLNLLHVVLRNLVMSFFRMYDVNRLITDGTMGQESALQFVSAPISALLESERRVLTDHVGQVDIKTNIVEEIPMYPIVPGVDVFDLITYPQFDDMRYTRYSLLAEVLDKYELEETMSKIFSESSGFNPRTPKFIYDMSFMEIIGWLLKYDNPDLIPEGTSRSYFDHACSMVDHRRCTRLFFKLKQQHSSRIPFCVVINPYERLNGVLDDHRKTWLPSTWIDYTPLVLTHASTFKKHCEFSIIQKLTRRTFERAVRDGYWMGTKDYVEYEKSAASHDILLAEADLKISLHGVTSYLPTKYKPYLNID